MKSFIGKKSFKYGALVVLLVLVLAVVAYAATVPYTFSSGTTAKSSEVNSNFTYLANRSWELSSSNLYYSNGNVGIGESSPMGLLQVGGTSSGSLGKIYFGNTNSSYGAIGFVSIYRWFQIVSQVSNGSMDFIINGGTWTWQDSGGTEYMRLMDEESGSTKKGYLGIGTSVPTYPLHMASGAYVTTGGVWTNASSRAYKEHIKELSSETALEAFEQLKPVTFNYKTDKSDKHIGFIAEDVPEIIATKDRKGLSSMDVVALLTKVVQEQQKTIATLSEKVERLENKSEAR
ncbi:tail fiber domain-containing protein [Candidatus Magnetomonas plexicatena]|uniref:tail fiber domain-containing protein n=1 Tax=Candidatus Magnetomonas plexicatena TaxID=2552947 RepID=UPI00110293BF|nr:tail fiber domain-containing protein [Nitrospirales bacterium LBB_01]